MMQGYTASQKEDLLVGFAVLALHDGGVEVSVSTRLLFEMLVPTSS
jgi:hypothetical protein